MLIGKRVKDLRLSKGISQQKLGDTIGVTKVSVCGYEKENREPSLSTICLLADFFDTSVDYLVGREEKVIINETDDIAYISKDDLEILKEIKSHAKLYLKLLKAPKRYVNYVDKRTK